MQPTMTFEESVARGLRLVGDETTDDGRRHRARYRWAANRAHLAGARSILDWGCGSGYGTAILAESGLDALGFDVDPAAVAYGQDRWYSALHAELPGGPFDVVVCLGVMEHIEAPLKEQVLEMLKWAPIVIGMVPYAEKPGGNEHHFWTGITEREFAGLGAFFWYEPPTMPWDALLPEYPTHRVDPTITLLFEVRR